MEELRAAREAHVAAHAELRQTPKWKNAHRRIGLITSGFLLALHSSWLMSTRLPAYYDNTLTFRFMDDLLESAITVYAALGNGALNPARRELRFALETAINHAYIDRQLGKATLETKLTYLEVKDVDIVRAARILGLQIPLGPLYGKLSQVVHPTPAQLRVRLEQSARGIYIGFETPRELTEFSQLLLEVYDIALWCVFDSLGWGLTGDLFISVFDELVWWPFHHAPLTYKISSSFNYKAERQGRRAGPMSDRVQEFLRVLKNRSQQLEDLSR